jgi:spore maturation protein CgeB
MRIVVFGLTVSSSWGNGHATLWRGLARALARAGHAFTFFERDVPYYARHRDLRALEGAALHLYPRWEDVLPLARRALDQADCALVTSYCPDARAASELVLGSRVPVRGFYDLDTPVTLARRSAGEVVDYLGPDGLAGFDLVLSFTGGAALTSLHRDLGARRVVPLYGSVDPEVHHPVAPDPRFRADLSYLGTWAANRQEALDRLFLAPAELAPERTFIIGGSGYGPEFPWRSNIYYISHLPPPEHAAFYCSSPLTLNVTRGPMAAMGYCPSGRIFEAAACGAPVISDSWEGLDRFFEPGREILVARGAGDVLEALELGPARLANLGRAARRRALAEHTAAHRAEELLEAIRDTARPIGPPAGARADVHLQEGG